MPMELKDLIGKTCVIGLSYFDQQGELMKQTQYAGSVPRSTLKKASRCA